MSQAAGSPAEHTGEAVHAEHVHPSAATYVKIGVVLAILTGLEVAAWYIPMAVLALTLILIALSIAKFALVVMFYMHLKFDHRLFAGMFVWGIVLALSVILALMAMYAAF